MLEELANFNIQHAVFVLAVFISAAILRAFTGFGFSLISVPALSIFLMPAQAAALSTTMALSLNLMSFPSYRQHIDLRPLTPIICTILIGTVIGTIILSSISQEHFRLLIGGFLIIISIVLIFMNPETSNYRIQPGRKKGLFTGLISGLMNGSLGIPGPPIIIYAMLTETDAVRNRAFLMTIFLIASSLASISFFIAGFMTKEFVIYFFFALPALIMGNILGHTLFQKYGKALHRNITLIALLTIGLIMAVKA